MVRSISNRSLWVVAGAVLWGFVVTGRAQQARPLEPGLPVFKAGDAAAPPPSPEGVITLSRASALALMHNPDLAAYSWEVRVSEAERWQAGARLNPEVIVDVEDFAGTGALAGFGGSHTTVQIAQTFEPGGKRAARLKAVDLNVKQAGWEFEAARLNVLRDVSLAFSEVVAAQRGLLLADTAVALTDRTLEALNARSTAGRASANEASIAKAAAAQARIRREWAAHRLDEAREGLAALWGSPKPSFERAQGDFDSLSTLPPYEELLDSLNKHPRLAGLNAARAAEEAQADAERAARWPGVTLRGGYRRLADTDDHAAVAGVSVPLPLWNRNQGNILRARHNSAGLERTRQSAAIALRGGLAEAYAVAATTATEISLLRNEVLRHVEAGFVAATEGYDRGRYGYREVLDARQSLLAAREQHLRALLEHHQAIANLESLTGRPLSALRTERILP